MQAAADASTDTTPPEMAHVCIAPTGEVVLTGAECADCGGRHFPPTGICPACASISETLVELPREGVVYSETVVHVAPPPWVTPYAIGYVDLTDGVRVFSHLTGGAGIGDRVRLATAQVGRHADGTPVETFVFEKAEASR